MRTPWQKLCLRTPWHVSDMPVHQCLGPCGFLHERHLLICLKNQLVG